MTFKANSTATLARSRLSSAAGLSFGGERDLYEVCGYPRELTVEDYTDTFKRGDIAGRIIWAYPEATWREPPVIKGTPEFTAAFEVVAKARKVWSMFKRLDLLTQLGHYGVLLLGLDGGEPLHTPATGTNYRLKYLKPHGERTAKVTQWENDPASARYGQPLRYSITVGTDWPGRGGAQSVLQVHFSRVIHCAERALEDESIGTPRLEGVFNRLMDIDKLLGGSAEMYWQNVAMLMAFIADADVNWEPEEKQDMADQLEELQHGLRRMLRLRGVDTKNLAPGLQGAKPAEHIDPQISMLAGSTGIPKRILMGNEAGEMGSSQDETAWQGRVAERRGQFATPEIIEKFVEAGLRLGFLPAGYDSTEWPESDTLGEKGRAEVADVTTRAVSQYINTMGSENVLTEDEFRAMLGYDPLEAEPEEAPLEEDAFGPVPEPEPERVGEEVAEPEKQALNGAQIAGLQTIIESTIAGLIPVESAKAITRIAFPSLGESEIESLFPPAP